MHSFYMVRHGKSELEGDEAARPLMAEGLVQARQVSDKIASLTPSVVAIYSSPFTRARQTLEPLAEALGLPITVVDELREKHMSDEPIPDLPAARSHMWEDFDFRLTGGETNAEAQVRATTALKKVQSAHPSEAIAVVSHGTLMGLILNTYDSSFGYEEWRAITMPDIFRVDVPLLGAPVVEHIGCDEIETFKVKG